MKSHLIKNYIYLTNYFLTNLISYILCDILQNKSQIRYTINISYGTIIPYNTESARYLE